MNYNPDVSNDNGRNKRLGYRRGTAWCVMLANSCYVSRGMGVRKFSNNNSDLQGHSRALKFCQDLWHQKTRIFVLLCGNVCVILSCFGTILACDG